ncbi:MAG: hypothetical protein ABI273_15550 [Lacunisphaera sp.]
MKKDSKIAPQRSTQDPEVGSVQSGSAFSSESTSSVAPFDLTVMARRLIVGEQRANDSSDTAGRAAFRVCEKLRPTLASLIGVGGFHSIFSRALALARDEEAWLCGVELEADGAIKISSERQLQFDGDDAARGGIALIAQLHKLLITFIGEGLTLRLVHNVWPEAAVLKSDSVENNHEKTA